MAPGLKSRAVALIIALIFTGPAYWAGYHAASYLMRRETEEYRVWQESYHIDRRFYEAISKNPPPAIWPTHPGRDMWAAGWPQLSFLR